jgi:hypothetical protein
MIRIAAVAGVVHDKHAANAQSLGSRSLGPGVAGLMGANQDE